MNPCPILALLKEGRDPRTNREGNLLREKMGGGRRGGASRSAWRAIKGVGEALGKETRDQLKVCGISDQD